jgi:hypothetical protein
MQGWLWAKAVVCQMTRSWRDRMCRGRHTRLTMPGRSGVRAMCLRRMGLRESARGGAWSEILGCACSVGLALRDSVFGSIYSPKTLSRRGVSSLCKRRRNSTVVTSLGGPTPLRSRRDCAHGGHLILGSVFWFRSLRNTIFCEESECRRPGPSCRLLRCLLLAAGGDFRHSL